MLRLLAQLERNRPFLPGDGDSTLAKDFRFHPENVRHIDLAVCPLFHHSDARHRLQQSFRTMFDDHANGRKILPLFGLIENLLGHSPAIPELEQIALLDRHELSP